eukprot:489762_1
MHEYSTGWYCMTVILPLCCVICLILALLQAKSFGWYKSQSGSDLPGYYNNRYERIHLYGVFLFGVLCSTQCFSLHIANVFPDWYCVYGISTCTVFYFAEKSFLYAFFLERAKSVQVLLDKQILPRVCTHYILPIYIALYFAIFSALALIGFRGKVLNPLHEYSNDDKPITSCLFFAFYAWLFESGAVIDAFNSTSLLALFIYPLWRSIESNNASGSSEHNEALKRTVTTNVACSTVCMLSSICTMTLIARFIQIDYIWLAGNIDMLINSLFTFMMTDANRQYTVHLWNKMKCKGGSNHSDSNSDTSEMDSKTSRDLSTIYEAAETSDIMRTTVVNFSISSAHGPQSILSIANWDHGENRTLNVPSFSYI